MSDKQHTESLPETFLTIGADAFGDRDQTIRVHVNHLNPDIVQLEVGGLRIATVRDNWAAIFRTFAEVITAHTATIVAPQRRFRMDFDDENRTLVRTVQCDGCDRWFPEGSLNLHADPNRSVLLCRKCAKSRLVAVAE